MQKFGQFKWEEICSGKGTSRACVPRIRVSPPAIAKQTAEAALEKCFMKAKILHHLISNLQVVHSSGSVDDS